MNPTRLLQAALMLGLSALAACRPDAAPAPAAQPQAADAHFTLPGDYSERTTLADLQARFGKANVRIDAAPEHAVVLFPDDPGRRAYVNFYDPDTLQHLASIAVRDAGSRWRGKHGVHVGMSFAQLRQLNGKPFWFSGFDGEHRAWAHGQWSPALDDDDSRLGAFDVEEGERLYFNVDLGVRKPSTDIAAGELPADENLSSDDPRFPRLGERVIVTGFSAGSSLDDEWE